MNSKVVTSSPQTMRLLFCFIFIIQNSVASLLCDGKICIKKCCPEDKYFFNRNVCIAYPERKGFSNVTVFSDNFIEIGLFDDYFTLQEGPGALQNESIRINSYRHGVMYKDDYHLREDGQMILEKKNEAGVFHYFLPNEYCLDYLMVNGTPTNIIVVFQNKDKDAANKGHNVALKWGFPISSLFLFLVLVVYSLLPELRNLGGLILMAYVASLMFAFIFLFCIQIDSYKVEVCLALTSLTYFFMLASFGWLNVMSLDIWWTFRGLVKARATNRRGEIVKFLIYCAYAFGVPLGLTVALVTLNEVNRHHHRLRGIVPNIPLQGCFIEGKAKYAYLYAPMLIMIVVNWVFFLLTAVNIWQFSRDRHMLRSADSAASGSQNAQKSNKMRLVVYLKLSVLMGLSWILEVISTTTPDFGGWYITDCYNVLIGVVIFIIFVCNRKIINKLRKRYTNFKNTHSFKSKSRSRSTQDESHTQSTPLQSKEDNIKLQKITNQKVCGPKMRAYLSFLAAIDKFQTSF